MSSNGLVMKVTAEVTQALVRLGFKAIESEEVAKRFAQDVVYGPADAEYYIASDPVPMED